MTSHTPGKMFLITQPTVDITESAQTVLTLLIMKTKKLFFFLLVLLTTLASAQSVPSGIRYQSVARNDAGELISDQTLSIKVSLKRKPASGTQIYYSELHTITTNSVGAYSLVIGKGTFFSGDYFQIPWSSDNIWVEIAQQSSADASFVTVSNSQLMTVPYAFHAATASVIAGAVTATMASGSNASSGNSILATSATSWQTTGSSASTPPTQYFGTADCKDLVFKTNAAERMRIFCNGNVYMNNSFSISNDLKAGRDAFINNNMTVINDENIESNLTAGKNVFLNLTSDSTFNYGSFNVGNVSPSVLTGSLRVDLRTRLNNGLNVNNVKPTTLTGTLKVNNGTNLYSSLTVNNQAPTLFTGTLRVDSVALFKNKFFLSNAAYNSNSTTTGALVVYGGMGIRRNLNVGGDAKFGGKTTLNGQVIIKSLNAALQPDSGALIVTGGMGVGKELSVRGYAHLYDSAKVDRITNVGQKLSVADKVTILRPTEADTALRVNGGTVMNGIVKANGRLLVNTPLLSSGVESDYNDYAVRIQGGSQGIAITTVPKMPSDYLSNNYITFWDQNGMQGRVEGFSDGQWGSTRLNTLKESYFTGQVTMFYAIFGVTLLKIANDVAEVTGASTSVGGCFGFGACITAPVPSLITAALINLAADITAGTLAIVNVVRTDNQKDQWDIDKATLRGVTYETGAGDYAEYIEAADPLEKMFPGDVVGLKRGKIYRNTEGADRIMVLSVNPAVLGNMPAPGQEKNFRKVAFMGQVPVKVIGVVHEGDYILPAGNSTGMGIAVDPEKIALLDMKYILGVAWSASAPGAKVSSINVAIGLHVNTNNRQVEAMTTEVGDLKSQLKERNKRLKSLLKGYVMPSSERTYTPYTIDVAKESAAYGRKASTSGSRADVFFHITRDDVAEGVEMTQKILTAKNTTSQGEKELLKVLQSSDREEFINKLYSEIEKEQQRKMMKEAAYAY